MRPGDIKLRAGEPANPGEENNRLGDLVGVFKSGVFARENNDVSSSTRSYISNL
jgi:hypothetical protein